MVTKYFPAHPIKRAIILENVMALFSKEHVLQHNSLRIRFIGKKAIDTGVFAGIS